MLVVADYDCDGATACAVGVRGLRMFGAQIDYLVPNRFEYGYGLTPEIVALAARRAWQARFADHGGQRHRQRRRRRRGERARYRRARHRSPSARRRVAGGARIVNPNQPGCAFPSKYLAGVGVMFYVLLALRAELRRRGAFDVRAPEPRLDGLLDLVALGTVADVVRLDANNRMLVAQGLKRIRAGRMQPGIAALFRAAARDARGRVRLRPRLRARAAPQCGGTARRT